VEHVAVVEDHLFGQIAAAHAAHAVDAAHAEEAPVVNPRREALIQARGTDRSFRIEAPEVARPTGRFATLAAAMQRFLTARECTIRFVEIVVTTCAPG
jgi:hypothetical protein